MPSYTQAQRPLEVITPLGPDALLIEGLSGREMLSGLFHFQVDMLSEVNTDIPFEKLLGQKMTVLLRHGENLVRCYSGICKRFRQGGVVRHGDHLFLRYRAEVVPWFWLWTRQVQSRIFQDQTVLEILRAVFQSLDPAFVYVATDVKGHYEPRSYCVQFQESSFAFLSRLLEQVGIYYYFEHTDKGHRLVLSDQSLLHLQLPKPYDPVVFQEGKRGDVEAITSWEKLQDVVSAKYVVRDYSFEMPHSDLEAQSKLRDKVNIGGIEHTLSLADSERLEVYEHNGQYAHRFDSIDAGGKEDAKILTELFKENKRVADLHMERTAVETVKFEGTSSCRGFVPGYTFTLDTPARVKGKYLLTYVEHSARQAPYFSGAESPFHYENRFHCVPAEMPYRPPLATPVQAIHGTMTASVAGGKEGEICTDKFGRIKVRFHWDRRDQGAANNSCWIRVVQSWAGKNWGMVHLPRVGQEVVVAFEEGHPDRPIVLGSVYNAVNLPPYALPDKADISGIKSQTLGEEPGQSGGCLLFTDTKDQQVARLHSEKDLIIDAKEELHLAVGNEMLNMVGWNFPKLEWGHDFDSFKKLGGDVMQLLFGGARWDLTRGTHLTAEGLLSTHYTLMSRNEVVIDPWSWSALVMPTAWLGNAALVTKVPMGRSEMVYGSRNTTGFGVECWKHHGPYLQRVASSKPWEKAWAIGHSAASLATCVLPFLYTASGDKGLGLAAELVNDAAGVFLAFSNLKMRALAIAQGELDAGEVGADLIKQVFKNIGLTAVSAEGLRYVDYAAELAKTSSVIHNHSVEGIYGLQAERIQLLSRARGGISLISRGTGPILLDSIERHVALASGGNGILVSGADNKIEIMVGPPLKGNKITIVPEAMTLECGPVTKITLTDQTITLKAGTASLELGPAGAVKINGQTLAMTATTSATMHGAKWNFSL